MTRVLLVSAVTVTLAHLATAGQRRLTLSEADRLARAALSEERDCPMCIWSLHR